MTDAEIRISYKYAVNKKEQLEILAQLNACSVKTIIKKLNAMGIETVELKKTKHQKKAVRWRSEDVVQLLELWQQGKNLKDISHELRRSEAAIKNALNRLNPNTVAQPTATMLSGLKRWKKQQLLKTR